MDPLEVRLKQALKQEEPPEGFTDRVMARVRTAGKERVSMTPGPAPVPWWRGGWFRPAWRVALVGGLAGLLLISLGLFHRWRQEKLRAEQERLRGEQARAQLLLALEITSSKLDHVRQLVVEQSRRPRAIHKGGIHESQN